MTYSVGFRAPQRGGLAGELALRMAEAFEDTALYRDPGLAPAVKPAEIPHGLQRFASDAIQRMLSDRQSLACALGEVMTEPKPRVWFDEPAAEWQESGVRLDRRTRMMYDQEHVFINGEGFRAAGADARLMRELADRRALTAQRVARASDGAKQLLRDWFEAGWLQELP
jgi:50S ribosomal protein L16 3-hydroxylase